MPYRNLLSVIVLILCVASCQKEISYDKPPVPQQNKYLTLYDFFQTNLADTQSFSLKNNTGGVCQTKKGTRYHFPPSCFGNVLPGETVDIDILEIFTPYEMIINNKPTVSNGKPLISGGEFRIRATLKGKELKLDPGKFIRIEVNGDFPSGMSVFNGTEQPNGTVNWTLNTNQNNVVINRRDSASGNVKPGYDLFCDSLQWINCDKFVNEPRIKCSFTPVDCPAVDSTAIYIHLTGRNSVLNVYNISNNVFYSEDLIATPVTVIGICYKNQQFYVASSSLTLSGNLVTTLKFTPISEEELKKKLQALK